MHWTSTFPYFNHHESWAAVLTSALVILLMSFWILVHMSRYTVGLCNYHWLGCVTTTATLLLTVSIVKHPAHPSYVENGCYTNFLYYNHVTSIQIFIRLQLRDVSDTFVQKSPTHSFVKIFYQLFVCKEDKTFYVMQIQVEVYSNSCDYTHISHNVHS